MDLSKVNRVEVIKYTTRTKLDFHQLGVGRVYSYWDKDNQTNVQAVLQDDDRTLKIFISEKK